MNFTDYRIVIAADATIDIKAAAKKLLSHFGAKEIVTDDTPAEGKEILLGRVARTKSLPTRPDSYVITFRGDDFVIDASHYTAVRAAVGALCLRDPESITVCYATRGTVDVPLQWGKYKLVWNDEFDGDDLDLDKWTGHCNMAADDIIQTMDPGTVDVMDGKLVLTTHLLDREKKLAGYKTNYSITTTSTMNFRHGYMEIRAKVPHYAMGEWPSYWFLSSCAYLAKEDYEKKHGKPRKVLYDVEVDMFEVFSDKTHVCSCLHKWGKNHYASGDEKLAYHFNSVQDANDWHTYGMHWHDDKIEMSVDGTVYYVFDLTEEWGEGEQASMRDFDQPLCVLFNNFIFTPGCHAFGPYMYAYHDDLFPLIYQIDYCRLYQDPDDEKSELYLPADAGMGYRLSPKTSDWRGHGNEGRSATWRDYVNE